MTIVVAGHRSTIFAAAQERSSQGMSGRWGWDTGNIMPDDGPAHVSSAMNKHLPYQGFNHPLLPTGPRHQPQPARQGEVVHNDVQAARQ